MLGERERGDKEVCVGGDVTERGGSLLGIVWGERTFSSSRESV